MRQRELLRGALKDAVEQQELATVPPHEEEPLEPEERHAHEE